LIWQSIEQFISFRNFFNMSVQEAGVGHVDLHVSYDGKHGEVGDDEHLLTLKHEGEPHEEHPHKFHEEEAGDASHAQKLLEGPHIQRIKDVAECPKRSILTCNGEPITMEQLGPIVISSGGQLGRIANWTDLSKEHKDRAMKIIAKRNLRHLEEIKQQHA